MQGSEAIPPPRGLAGVCLCCRKPHLGYPQAIGKFPHPNSPSPGMLGGGILERGPKRFMSQDCRDPNEVCELGVRGALGQGTLPTAASGTLCRPEPPLGCLLGPLISSC